MKKIQITSMLCAASLLFTLTACGKAEDTTVSDTTAEATEAAVVSEYAGQTLTGKVTAIDGTSVSLALGTLEESAGNPGSGETPPEKPDGDTTDPSSGETPSEQPDGDTASSSSSETPPEKPDGDATDSSSSETPPEKPDGDTASSSSSETPPEKPEGNTTDPSNGETPSDKPEGSGMGGSVFTENGSTATFDLSAATITKSGETIALSTLTEGDILTLTIADNGTVESAEVQTSSDGMLAGQPGGFGGFGGSGEITQGTAATTIDSDGTYDGEAYTSTGDDENALRIDGASVTLTGITVSKSAGSSSNTEDGDFYGQNAALLATNGASVTIENAEITSSAQNGNGVFSYGSGTVVTISDSTITTTADNSGGIQTTGGGTTIASNLTVDTSGNSAAAIRSDRGGGTVQVDGGTYTSHGLNSPAVYSTADITVKNAMLTATGSEALVIEGENSITLENCTVSGNMSDTDGTSSDENVHNVMIYQSMSGDADVGTSLFSMTGGSLHAGNGDMFYITNTHCIMSLSGVAITTDEEDGYLFRIVGNSASHGWGTAGSNGAQLDLTCDNQTLSGNILVDTISQLNLTLENGSTFTGTITIADNAAGGTAVEDNAVVTIGEGCTWTLTGNCTITSLENLGTIDFNDYTITLADGTVLSE